MRYFVSTSRTPTHNNAQQRNYFVYSMCLYETKLKNIKYLPNKKNGGHAPILRDLRLSTITTGCGWCIECRKKLANDWRIRLYEEIKSNKDCNFVTLSFSPAAIEKLETQMYAKSWHGIQPDKDGVIETDVNDLAAYAIRMWTERWRKHHKKAPRHWLITELGHKNSERIHLHGLVWGKAEEIKKTWQYGNVFNGQWVDNRTINYIVKYVTKLDEYHKGYKQKIYTSKGMGKDYVIKFKNWHKYSGEKTITYYKGYNGIKLGLPRYYKEKLWTEEQREELRLIKMDENKIYIDGIELKTTEEEEKFDKTLEGARERNINIGYGDTTWGNKKYIITEAMKKNYKELINYNKTKLVKHTRKRIVDKIIKAEKLETNSKTNYVTRYFYYHYIGNTTEAQRNYNELLSEAKAKKISVRVLRLIKEGIIVNNYVDKL